MNRITLPLVIYEATRACNLSCRYCYNHWKVSGDDVPDQPDEQDEHASGTRTLRRLYGQARVNHLTISGGEPLTIGRLSELVLLCRLQSSTVSLITNGTLCDRTILQTMKSLNVTLLQMPVHSADPVVHDHLVNQKGAWERVQQSIELALSLQLDIVPVIVLTAVNRDGLEQTLRFLHARGLRRIMLNRINIGGSAIAHATELNLTPDDLRAAYTCADNLARTLGLEINSSVCTPVCLLNPDDYPSIRFSFCDPDPARRPITINAQGEVRYCNHSPEVLGSIHHTPINSILKSAEFTKWERTVPAACSACTDFFRCRGGCRAASQQLGQTLDCVDPVLGIPALALSDEEAPASC